MVLLDVKQLNVCFNSHQHRVQAVKDLNFSVHQNRILGIVGESGSGKTITAMSILRLLPTNALLEGSILWSENEQTSNLCELEEDRLRAIRGAKISMIFQESMSSLNPVLTCGYQVGEGIQAHRLYPKSEIKDRVLYWLEKVGLPDPSRVYNSYPHQLSGGQLQRVLIAIALSCNPKLIIADEPTTALDVGIQKHIIEMLLRLKQDLGLSMLFISHDLGVIREICDDVLVMKNGRKIEQGPVNEIFKNPQQQYTKGLLYCRPPLQKKLRRLPTMDEFERGTGINHFDDTQCILPSELDRKLVSMHSTAPLISVKDLNVYYPKKKSWWQKSKKDIPTVKNFNLDIFPGEVIGLVGESGSGKSTTGKAILQLLEHCTGSVAYLGKNLSQTDKEHMRTLRKDLQIIFQDPYSSLNPRLTVGDAIVEPMTVHGIGKNKNERINLAKELLAEVGLLPEHFDKYPHQFSGGQRQRICIARVLCLKPRFIICDESVSALDVSVQAQVLNLLQDLKEKFKLSYLFISHDLSVIHFISDRILVMKDGEVVEEGKSYEIIKQAKTDYTRNLLASIPGSNYMQELIQ